MKRVALGKGIKALIPETLQEKGKVKKEIFELEIERIKKNPLQPRGSFNQDKLTGLANSIKEKGVL